MDTGLADDGALLGACPSQSPVDGRLLDQLSSGDIARMDAQSRVTVLLALERERSRIDALRQEVLSAIAVNDLSAQQWCREEIGAALRLSPVTAHARLKDAEQLVTRLPEVHQALRDGRICELQARAITEASYRLPEEAYPALQERALRRADEQSLQQTRQVLRRAVISLDPHGTQRRHLNAVADRRVRISDAEDGMAWLSVLLPALHALACYNRLDQQARAERTGEDGSGDDGMACDRRTLDQLRADHLVAAVLGETPTATNPRASCPDVSVVVSATTLLGQDDEPGWLDGYGPITADTARAVAHDPSGTWRRLITDPTSGQLLDHGRSPSRRAGVRRGCAGTAASRGQAAVSRRPTVLILENPLDQESAKDSNRARRAEHILHASQRAGSCPGSTRAEPRVDQVDPSGSTAKTDIPSALANHSRAPAPIANPAVA
jgi:hypothetical protein